MKKILLYALLITNCTLLFAGCGFSSNEREKLIIGIDDEFAPMGFRDEGGNIVGFDVDLAKEAAARMDVELEFVPILWDNKEKEITSGNIDMIWNGCDIMEEYKNYMTFSEPYMDNRQILLVRKSNTQGIHNLNDLKDKVVGTQSGSNSEDYVEENPDLKNSFDEFKTYRNIKEGFTALNARKCDVLIIDEIAARYEIIKKPATFEIIDLTVGPVTEFGIGFRKDNVELRDRVQKVFDEMIEDGTAKKISMRWFGSDLVKVHK